MKNKLFITLLLCASYFFGQNNNICIQEVLDYENRSGNLNDTALATKNVFLSYTVKVTDWDDESTISNVKIYKMGAETRFFSEQVNMYTNEREVIVEIPDQKVIAINNTLPDAGSKQKADEFQELRKEFLDSCQVVSCESIGKNTKVLVLKVNPRQIQEGIKIVEMRYEYDTERKKVLQVKTTYHPDYKLKALLMIYRDFNTESTYNFTAFKGHFIDRKGQLTSKYKDYELVDSRDKKAGSSKK